MVADPEAPNNEGITMTLFPVLGIQVFAVTGTEISYILQTYYFLFAMFYFFLFLKFFLLSVREREKKTAEILFLPSISRNNLRENVT